MVSDLDWGTVGDVLEGLQTWIVKREQWFQIPYFEVEIAARGESRIRLGRGSLKWVSIDGGTQIDTAQSGLSNSKLL